MQTNTHEECKGYYKGHIMLHTILELVTSSGCWWIVTPPIWNFGRLLDMCSFNLHQDSLITLRHSFWPQSRVDVHASRARLLGNEEVCKEFGKDNHYIGPTSNCPHHISMLQ